MSSRRWRHLWVFLVVGALSLGAGALVKRPDAPLDLLCSGRSAHMLKAPAGAQWLLYQYYLDLRAEGLGDYKTSARLLDTSSGQVLGHLHRTASFEHRREGRRLLIHVQHSGKSETDNLQEPQLANLGLFLFTEQARLTYRVRHLSADSVLISNGLGAVLFCEQNLPRN
ncbi:hypothetical protein HNE05_05285 [Aquipseudomonas campi]|uniref:Uncharacterized protein n=1 Tax=Aquipseudomonas campi TaxID=2731681 RepID=A0A6M8FRQ7_9GAMM|nr:hypothetical protein [Pseudomonas campi]QKE62796.1 hypothetical protein HNE05_05285 [Pseudomonas campi]